MKKCPYGGDTVCGPVAHLLVTSVVCSSGALSVACMGPSVEAELTMWAAW